MNITGWQTILCSRLLRYIIRATGRHWPARIWYQERKSEREIPWVKEDGSSVIEKSLMCIHSAGLLRTTIPKSNCRPLPPPPRQDFIMACIHNAQLYTRKRNILSSEGMSWIEYERFLVGRRPCRERKSWATSTRRISPANVEWNDENSCATRRRNEEPANMKMAKVNHHYGWGVPAQQMYLPNLMYIVL